MPSLRDYDNPKEYAIDQAVEITKAYASTDKTCSSYLKDTVETLYAAIAKIAAEAKTKKS